MTNQEEKSKLIFVNNADAGGSSDRLKRHIR